MAVHLPHNLLMFSRSGVFFLPMVKVTEWQVSQQMFNEITGMRVGATMTWKDGAANGATARIYLQYLSLRTATLSWACGL